MSFKAPSLYSDQIDNICLESYPCQHSVCSDNGCQIMSGIEIVKFSENSGNIFQSILCM